MFFGEKEEGKELATASIAVYVLCSDFYRYIKNEVRAA